MIDNIILASNSPRRKELLSAIFSNFEIISPIVNENIIPSNNPIDEAIRIAELKCNYVYKKINEKGLVIAVDTLVFFNGKFLTKPRNKQDAFETLSILSGNQHIVISGICILFKGNKYVTYDKSTVTFKNLSENDINNYIEEFKPFDKAGSYGIQDGVTVLNYEGSYTNIVGLPLEKLKDLLDSISKF